MQLASSWSGLNPQRSDVGAGGPGAGCGGVLSPSATSPGRCRDFATPAGPAGAERPTPAFPAEG